ncbi:MAG TPA: LacI family DNA-binding transcriptional regulator [Vicinamibacterales bacterium]
MAPRVPGGSPAPGGPVTLRMLADYLGLSPASVSLVLNQAPGARAIPAATQERIRAAARELGYRPNTLAQSLRRQRSQTIGVLVSDMREGYATLVLEGVERRLLQENYLYFVASHHHRPDLLQRYPRLLLDRAVEGLIAVDTPCREELSVPVVAVSGHNRTAGVTNVVLNHERAALLALQHLAQLGHRSIAIIRGQPFSSDTDVRWQAIGSASEALGLTIDPRLVDELDGDSNLPELGYRATQRLLETGIPFSAIFAFNDVSAFGAIGALRDAGLSVPQDVSVVGFDDILSAAAHNPPLTTVRQPLSRMGELAAEVVIRRIAAGRDAPYSPEIAVEPELVVRGSTGPARPR